VNFVYGYERWHIKCEKQISMYMASIRFTIFDGSTIHFSIATTTIGWRSIESKADFSNPQGSIKLVPCLDEVAGCRYLSTVDRQRVNKGYSLRLRKNFFALLCFGTTLLLTLYHEKLVLDAIQYVSADTFPGISSYCPYRTTRYQRIYKRYVYIFSDDTLRPI